jgi:superfamily I DNA and/or RNA helicase
MSPDEENKEGVTVIKTQYRIAKAVCKWPSKYFYDGKLVTAESLIRHGPRFFFPIHSFPIFEQFFIYETQLFFRVFNVIDGIEQLAVDQSFNNEKEADLVANIVRVILESPFTSGKSIGVINFYISQKQCIIRKLNEASSRVEVNIADSFQGK